MRNEIVVHIPLPFKLNTIDWCYIFIKNISKIAVNIPLNLHINGHADQSRRSPIDKSDDDGDDIDDDNLSDDDDKSAGLITK